MKAQCRNLQLAGIDVVLPVVLSIDGREADSAKRTNAIVGLAAGYEDGIVPSLAAQWLSQLCHRHFIEQGRGADGNLAAEAFYDKLSESLSHDRAFVAALLARPRSGHIVNGDVHPGFGAAHLARWIFHGRVQAYVNPSTGTAQMTFDHLPGGITLASDNRFAASVSRAFVQCHEVSAWYGFGVPIREPAEAIMMLRNEIAAPRRSQIAARAHAHA